MTEQRYYRMGILAVLGSSLVLLPTAVSLSATPNTTTVATYSYIPVEHLFTGTVTAYDTAAQTLTINGHIPFRRETVEKVVARGTPAPKDTKPLVKDSTVIFHVPATCTVVLTNKPTAHLADVQSGLAVDVEYQKVVSNGTTNLVASTIRSQAKHPYDTLEKAAKK